VYIGSFDLDCNDCDQLAKEEARNAWRERVGVLPTVKECDWCNDPVWLLRRRIRELASGWGERLERCRKEGEVPVFSPADVYVPDQQGCLEIRQSDGGTLACPPSEECPDVSRVRVGVAKTKGKCRVVTMQGAYVKRTLRPVHNALYDHLTSYDWCVRGDVKREDFEAVVDDARNGEKIISGDYSAATDNIYHFAVEAIIDELSKDERLTAEEREVLVGSFTNLRWVSCSGKQYPIRRGSMMGNLVSFPLLCLLNKACYDITCDIFFGVGSQRVGRFNGDDCMFQGSESFYSLWRNVTSTYGFIVNEEKTGFDSEWADLNSQSFCVKTGRLIDKPILSFLRPFRKEGGDLLTEVLRGIKSFRKSVRAYILCVLMRHQIAARTICVQNIPRKTFRFLMAKRWFRSSIQEGPAPVEKTGISRTIPMVMARPPKSRYYPLFDALSWHYQKSHRDFWRGRRLFWGVDPYWSPNGKIWLKAGSSQSLANPMLPWCQKPATEKIQMSVYWERERNKPLYSIPFVLCRDVPRWRFCWMKPVLTFFERYLPDAFISELSCSSREWVTDHPSLSTERLLTKVKPRSWYTKFKKSFCPPRFYSERDRFLSDFPLGYV